MKVTLNLQSLMARILDRLRMNGVDAHLPNLSARIPETMRPAKDPAFRVARRLFDMYKLIP